MELVVDTSLLEQIQELEFKKIQKAVITSFKKKSGRFGAKFGEDNWCYKKGNDVLIYSKSLPSEDSAHARVYFKKPGLVPEDIVKLEES